MGKICVQDNQTLSRQGVLRGLRFQLRHPQGKLVRPLSGEAFDLAVDLRNGSATYGKWYGLSLSGENHKRCFPIRRWSTGIPMIRAAPPGTTHSWPLKGIDFWRGGRNDERHRFGRRVGYQAVPADESDLQTAVKMTCYNTGK